MYVFICHTWKMYWWYGFNLKLVWHLKPNILVVHLMLFLCPSNAFPLETCVLLNLWYTKSTECQTLNVTEKSLDYVQYLGKALNATRSLEKDLRTLGWTFLFWHWLVTWQMTAWFSCLLISGRTRAFSVLLSATHFCLPQKPDHRHFS